MYFFLSSINMDMGSQGHGMTRDPARDRMNRPLPREPFDPF